MANNSLFSRRKLLWVLLVVVIGLLAWRFSSIVAYILVASVLSLLGRPIVRLLGMIRIRHRSLPVNLRALFTLVLIWAFFLGFFRIFIPLIANEAQSLSQIDTAQLLEQFDEPIAKVEVWYDQLDMREDTSLSLRGNIQQQLRKVLNINVITELVTTMASMLGNLAWAFFAISFITFFLLREDRLIAGYLVTVVPLERVDSFTHALESIKHLLRRYFAGIVLQISGILFLVTMGMTIVGVGFRHALVIGLVAAVLNIIPYLGPWMGATLGLILGMASHMDLDFSTQLLPLLGYMAMVFFITQLIDNLVFQPVIFGNSVYAHPLEIFLVIMMAGSLAGIVGMILAVPAYTVIRVFAKEFFNNFRVVQKLTEKI